MVSALGMMAAAEAYDEAKHPRNPKGSPGGGRFRSLAGRLDDAVREWVAGGHDGDPFDGFDRDQLRRVAKARGLTLRRGASREVISRALLSDMSHQTPGLAHGHATLPGGQPAGLSHADIVAHAQTLTDEDLAHLHASISALHAQRQATRIVPTPRVAPPVARPSPAASRLGDTPIGERVRQAYAQLAPRGGWVSIADLRAALPDISRDDLDAELLRHLHGGSTSGVRIIPVANTKSLTPADRAGALSYGGEDNHILSAPANDRGWSR